MTSGPLVSIVTPFLNTEEFLEEAILSVLGQTYEPWELLLVDDGSTDGSTRIARNYADLHSGRIRYFDHEGHRNLGAGVSRNVGLDHARGEYIAFLDADDIYLPNKLEDQVRLLESLSDAMTIYASTQYWHSWSERPDGQDDWVWNNFGVPPESLVEPPQLLTNFLRNGGTVPCMGSLLVRQKLIERIGGFENDTVYQPYDDQVFYAKLCLETPVYVSGTCWDKYRQHPKSMYQTAKRTGDDDRARAAYLNWLEGYLQSKGIVDQELWRALRKQLRRYRRPGLDRFYKNAEQLGGSVMRVAAGTVRKILPVSLWQWLRARLKPTVD